MAARSLFQSRRIPDEISGVEYYALEQVAREIAELEKQGIAYESIAVPVSPVLLIRGEFRGYGSEHD
ncbi:MAG: hypothetical protein ACLUD2_03220 [Clostridium sp.]